MNTRVLAFDFGASSGRAILATYTGDDLSYKEVYRFENIPVERDGTLFWDFETLLTEVKTGIAKAGQFDSIGFDTWGVDFGLLDRQGALLQSPVHYRDTRTEGMLARVRETLPVQELYAQTGNQVMAINTLFQLMAMREKQPDLLERAHTLLFMPDLFSYMLGGEAVCERSIASTSQMLDPHTGEWNTALLDRLQLPAHILCPTVPSGTVTGTLANGAKIIAVAGHDTQCAVAAVPTQSDDVAFLSCGTWSLLGTELNAPILTERSCARNLSNELDANGKVNYLKNIIGLWLIQESRRVWQRHGLMYSFAEIAAQAEEAPALRCFIDPDAAEFTPPGDMPARVQAYCRRTGQYEPKTVGEISRCIYESLALKYRYALEQLREMTGKQFSALHIVGGGAQASLLCRMTADCCGIPVVAGPVEATALGNIVIQLVALGALPDIAAGRALIERTEAVKTYQPAHTEEWDRAYAFYQTLL